MSDKPTEFAQVALKHGLLTQAQLDECLELLEEAQEEGDSVSLEEVAVEEGFLTRDQVEAIQQRLIREIGGYKVLGKLGSGGMGSVYRAEQLSLGKIVAIKILPPKYARDQGFLARFEREARSLAKVNHRNIVRAIDFGKDKGYYFLSMEYAEGKSLYRLVKDGGPFDEARALDVVAQVADGLAHAAAHGLVHRDIKPENILFTTEGEAKILDFGLAKPEEEKNASFKTTAGITFGTPHFMSPEQVRADDDIDSRSDLYSLGATLYYLLTGKTPFEGKSDVEIMTAHLEQPVPDPRKLVQTTSKAAARIVRKLMAKDREGRYQTPADLLADLERVKNGEAPRFARGTTSVGLARTSSASHPAFEAGGAGPIRSRTTRIVAGVAVLLVLALAGRVVQVLVSRGGTEAEPVAAIDPPGPTQPGATPEPPVEPRGPSVEEVRAQIEILRRAHDAPPAELARAIRDADDLLARAASSPAAGEVRELREVLSARYARRALDALAPVLADSSALAAELRFADAARRLRAFLDEYPGSEAGERATQVLFDLRAAEAQAFERLIETAAREAQARRFEAAIAELGKAEGFTSAELRQRAQSLTQDYRELAAASDPPDPGPGPGPGPGETPPRMDATEWLRGALAAARDRRYEELLRTAEGLAAVEVKERAAHVQSALRFLQFAQERLGRLAAGARIELVGGREVVFQRLDGTTLRVLDGGAEAEAAAADLSAATLRDLVLSDPPPGAAAAAGHFFALDGYTRAARRWLAEGGINPVTIDQILATWKTDESGRVLLEPRDLEAKALLEAARADLAAGRAGDAEKAFRRLLDKFADTAPVEGARKEIEDGLRAARAAQVALENVFSASPARRVRDDAISLTYRLTTARQLFDWNLIGPPPSTRSGYLFVQDTTLELWKGVWTDFEFDCEWLFADVGDMRFLFRRETEGKYYEVRLSCRPGDNEYRVQLRKRIPGENGDNPQELAADDLPKFFPERGSAFQTRSRRFQVLVAGPRIKVVLNGKTAFEVEDGSIARGGFAIQAGGPKAIKDVTIVGRFDPAWEAETRGLWLDRIDLAEAAGLGPFEEGLAWSGYDDKDLGRMVARRTDGLVNDRWPRDTAPDANMPGNGFSQRWRGWIVAPADGEYRFFTRNDDGVRLWIGERQLIDDWKSHGPEDREGRVTLARGVHPIVLEHFDDGSDALLRFSWQGPGLPRRYVDGRFLLHTRKDIR